jgi:hypothetical protein
MIEMSRYIYSTDVSKGKKKKLLFKFVDQQADCNLGKTNFLKVNTNTTIPKMDASVFCLLCTQF